MRMVLTPLLTMFVLSCSATQPLPEHADLGDVVRDAGLTPFTFPRNDWKVGTLLLEVDGRLRVAQSHDFVPEQAVPRGSGAGDWGEFECATANDNRFELALIHGKLGDAKINAGLERAGLTSFTLRPGTIRTEWIAVDAARNYFNSPAFDASTYVAEAAPPRYLIVETAGTDKLEYDFVGEGSQGGSLNVSFLEDVLGLSADGSARIEEGRRLVIDEPRLLGYALVRFSALLEGKLGSGESAYVELRPVDDATYARLAGLALSDGANQ